MTIDSNKEDFKIKGGLWKDYKLYDLYKDAHTPFEWHKELFSYANKIGITLFLHHLMRQRLIYLRI